MGLGRGRWFVVWVLCLGSVLDAQVNVGALDEDNVVVVDAQRRIATTDENFVCATLDWWPAEKCDYGTCSWGNASLLRLDLKNPILLNAIKAFSPLKIRLGGTLQDKLIYQTEAERGKPCNDFIKNSSAMFGFNEGCLSLARWDELNSFFKKTGALVIFSLNALRGKEILPNNTAAGPWHPANAASLILYTEKKGYNIYGWELGNELSGRGVGVGIDANTYASDTMVLHDIAKVIYESFNATKPQVIAPGGFFEPGWFQQYLTKSKGVLDVISHHIYNLGPANDNHLVDKILDPNVLDSGGIVFRDLHNIIKASQTQTVAWVGEAGGAYNSGRDGVSNTFLFGFWYLDQLGQASIYDTKTYCRQSLIGGNYGLLDTITFTPNPDFYSALLWHKLMGANVLATNFTGTRKLRTFAHCAKQSQGITMLFLNIDKNTTVSAKVHFHSTPMRLHRRTRDHAERESDEAAREEYHLTPKGGDVQSRSVLLNGKALTVGPSGQIPDLKPVRVNSSEPITVVPFSIVFVHIPSATIPACRLV